jgi:hypothetical protein
MNKDVETRDVLLLVFIVLVLVVGNYGVYWLRYHGYDI